MTDDTQARRVNHSGTYYCTECGIDVRVGVIDGDEGLFCGCTKADGKPFKRLRTEFLAPWPGRWELEKDV